MTLNDFNEIYAQAFAEENADFDALAMDRAGASLKRIIDSASDGGNTGFANLGSCRRRAALAALGREQ